MHVTLKNRIYYSTKDLKILLDKKTGESVQHDYEELYVSHYYIHGSKVTSMIPSSPFTTSVLPKLVATAMANHFKEMSIAIQKMLKPNFLTLCCTELWMKTMSVVITMIHLIIIIVL